MKIKVQMFADKYHQFLVMKNLLAYKFNLKVQSETVSNLQDLQAKLDKFDASMSIRPFRDDIIETVSKLEARGVNCRNSVVKVFILSEDLFEEWGDGSVVETIQDMVSKPLQRKARAA